MIGKKEESCMDMNDKKILRTFGLVLYMLGAIIGFLLLTMSVWGDVEASTFSAALSSDEPLDTLNCPVFIAKDEVGVISAVIENGTDRDASPMVRSRVGMEIQVQPVDNRAGTAGAARFPGVLRPAHLY